MTERAPTEAESLLELLGKSAEDASVQAALDRWARGRQPELDPEDEEVLADWVTVNEIGLEFGFEDEAYVLALDPAERRSGKLLLTQLYFYRDTSSTRPFPHALPFGLSFEDDRTSARRKLAAHDKLRRSYRRDIWQLPKFNLVIAYVRESGLLESVFCYVRHTAWPAHKDEEKRVARFTPQFFAEWFGRRWSNADLRATLAPLGYEEALPEVRSEHIADLTLSHGLELIFGPSAAIRAADKKFPRSLALAGVSFYSSRHQDAREWAGSLPFGLRFGDTQAELREKVGADPRQRSDGNLSGIAIWKLEEFTLNVMYSNLENRLLQVTMYAPGFFEHEDPEEAEDERDEPDDEDEEDDG